MLYPPAVNIESGLEELTLKTVDARGYKSVDVVYPRRNKQKRQTKNTKLDIIQNCFTRESPI